MSRKLTRILPVSLVFMIFIAPLATPLLAGQSPIDRLKRNIPRSARGADDSSNSPARTEINGIKTILSNLRIRFKSPRWNEDRWVREIGDYIQRGEKYIAAIREKDPNHDASAYERDLQPYKAAYSEKGASLAAKDSYVELAGEKYNIAGRFPNHQSQPRFSNKREIENLFQIAQELDYPAAKVKLEEALVKFPELADDHKFKHLLREFPSQFQTLSESFISESNRFIELAYQTQSKNKLEAADHAESARMLTDLVLLVMPDHAQALALKKDADAAVNKIGGAIASSVYTGSFHKEHAGRIVFFNSPPVVKQEDASKVAAQFKAGDHIYAMAYLKGSLKDFAQLTNRGMLKSIYYRLYIDGNEYRDYGGFPSYVTWEQYKDPGTTYLKLDIIPDPAAIDYANPFQYDPVIKYAKVLGQSSPRRHKIEIKLQAEYTVIAEGAFELDLSEGQEKIVALSEQLHQEKISKVFLPKPRMTNAALQQAMFAALKSNGWKQQMLRAVITDSDWRIHRNALGAIEFRSIGAAVAMKEPDGRCRYFTLSFKQPYLGGRYGRTEQYGVGDNFEMLCSNVNK